MKKNLLDTLLKELKSKTLDVVFDLDSTLFDVSPRITQILHDFARVPDIIERYPKEVRILETLKPSPKDWGVKRTLERFGMGPPDEEFKHLLFHFWKTHFFSNNYLKYDRPYEGAVEYLLELENAGARIHYLTGRDQIRMKHGTQVQLQSHGFPLKKDFSNLHLKPNPEIGDVEYKTSKFEEFNKTEITEIWFFENEPTILKSVEEFFPQVKIVFVDTVHSEKIPSPLHFPIIKGFER